MYLMSIFNFGIFISQRILWRWEGCCFLLFFLVKFSKKESKAKAFRFVCWLHRAVSVLGQVVMSWLVVKWLLV